MDTPNFETPEQLRDFIQTMLGDEFIVEMPEKFAENDNQVLLGMVVRRLDGQEMTYPEMIAHLESKGVHVGIGFPGMNEVPDTIPEHILGADDPTVLNDKYGPRAADFVDQLGRSIDLEWTEFLQVMNDVVQHCKMFDLNEEDSGHLMAVLCRCIGPLIDSRMHLGAVIESYRRDHHLSAEDTGVLLRAATQRVADMAYASDDDEAKRVSDTKVAETLRKAYALNRSLDFSHPPMNVGMFQHLWNTPDEDHHDH